MDRVGYQLPLGEIQRSSPVMIVVAIMDDNVSLFRVQSVVRDEGIDMHTGIPVCVLIENILSLILVEQRCGEGKWDEMHLVGNPVQFVNKQLLSALCF